MRRRAPPPLPRRCSPVSLSGNERFHSAWSLCAGQRVGDVALCVSDVAVVLSGNEGFHSVWSLCAGQREVPQRMLTLCVGDVALCVSDVAVA